MKLIKRFLPIIILTNLFAEIDYSIIESNEYKLTIELNINLESEEDLKPISLLIGLPDQEYPELLIENSIINNVNSNWQVPEVSGVKWIKD